MCSATQAVKSGVASSSPSSLASVSLSFRSTCTILLFYIVVLILLVVILYQFIQLFTRSHFSHMFSLYSHGILGVVFTPPVGYSRPPSAVNDPTVTKQVNSGKSCLEEVSQVLVYQVALRSISTGYVSMVTFEGIRSLCRIGIVSEPILFERIHQFFVIVNFLWSQMVGMIFVRKIIHLATKIFGSTNFNHIPAEFVISYKSIVDTLVVFLFALLLELMGDVVFFVSWLLPISVPVRSPFLFLIVRNRKEVYRVLDEFLILLCSFSQEMPARAVDDANVPV